MTVLNQSAMEAIARADTWLDAETGPSYKEQPLAQTWARICKAIEEGGEVVGELILATGQNPRKPAGGSRHTICEEMADRACSALLAIQHLTKSADETDSYLAGALVKVNNRAREAGY